MIALGLCVPRISVALYGPAIAAITNATAGVITSVVLLFVGIDQVKVSQDLADHVDGTLSFDRARGRGAAATAAELVAVMVMVAARQ